MKKIILFVLISSALLLSSIANSAIITANGVSIKPIKLTKDYDSFLDFYDYRLSDSSSHTGFEKKNRVVVFLAQIKNEIALIMTAGGPQTDGGIAYTGALTAIIEGSEGSIAFVDDPDGTDPVNGSTINWAYARGKNDGLIYDGLFSRDWLINISLQKVGGGLSGIDILTFKKNNIVSTALSMEGISKNHFSKIAIKTILARKRNDIEANAPAAVVLFGLALAFLGLRNKH